MGIVVSINYIEMVDNGFGELEPVIAGTKITVHDVVGMCVLGKSTMEWIEENYEITPAQVHAALSYYYDHKEQIDHELQQGDKLAEHIGTPSGEFTEKAKGKRSRE